MSLYHEAATFIVQDGDSSSRGSLKSRVFANKKLKSPATQVYALAVESTRWSSVLSPVIEKAGLLTAERKLSPALALLLTHDLLISNKGIALPKDHGLRQTLERHRVRLSSELTRARLQAKVASLCQWKEKLASQNTQDDEPAGPRHPRWVRVNTLRGDGDSGLLEGRVKAKSVADIVTSSSSAMAYAKDEHVDSLFALPASTDMTSTAAYKQGKIILQDKASCFPATLLDPSAVDGDIIDACAAPGNKTTHLAALLTSSCRAAGATPGRIFAVERDAARAQTLQKMVKVAGADRDGLVQCLPKQDFMRLDPKDARFANVTAILLDPSCSGSGIVGRDEDSSARDPVAVLPSLSNAPLQPTSRNRKTQKRKRAQPTPPEQAPPPKRTEATPDDPAAEQEEQPADSTNLPDRLEKLSNFQTAMVQHAMAFPAARRIVYSTCSVHAEENEAVVLRALASRPGRGRAWRVLSRAEQADCMREWSRRGDAEAVRGAWDAARLSGTSVEEIAAACIRCAKGTEEGTMGFFAVGFVRDEASTEVSVNDEDDDDESEWGGLSDGG